MSRGYISNSTLRRLPVYLQYLRSLDRKAHANVSSAFLAASLMLGEVQVRKDLAVVGAAGRPKTGYDITELIGGLERMLGVDDPTKAIIVGVGRLGAALLGHSGFEEFGLKIIAGFDIRQEIIGQNINNTPILSAGELEECIAASGAELAILTLSPGGAQEAADKLAACGIKAIWNFTQTHIVLPSGVAVRDENLAASLASFNLQLRFNSAQ